MVGRTDRCSVILEGMAFSYKLTRPGRRQVLNLHLAGDLPDLQGLRISNIDIGVVAANWCRVGYVPHVALNDLCSRRPGLMDALWRETLLDAAIGSEWLSNLGRRGALARLSHLLCEVVVRHRSAGLTSDYSCSFPLTQTALADALGLSTVHINRALQKLRHERLMELKDRRLTVLDWDRLCEIAEFDPAYLYLERHPPIS